MRDTDIEDVITVYWRYLSLIGLMYSMGVPLKDDQRMNLLEFIVYEKKILKSYGETSEFIDSNPI
jgi:hypothetical protein